MRAKCKCWDASCAICIRRQIKAGKELQRLTAQTKARLAREATR